MNANSYAKDCTARCLERLRDVGDRTLSNVGFSVTGENAVAFGALLMDTADEIERLNRVISETVNQRDAALALLREAQEVLADHWFTSVMDGDYGEDFNNEDVIAMDDKIKKFLPEAPK